MLNSSQYKNSLNGGNDFNKKVNSEIPPKYDFNEVTVEQVIDGKIKKYRLDGYNEGLEIVSRKATDFDNIKTSTFESYCNELINKYKVGTKITAPKYSELNGKTLQGKYKLEVPKSNEISSKLNELVVYQKCCYTTKHLLQVI
ncbi:hypothetical protein [Empedobacter tilapiae]|uniref:hypothetical protein n=1 Tax=Empedobacter tilapiae TaxID=2491114 RepID=UPI0028D042CE|nr:hypothetical protein [Empedobacter tilapiae]